MKKKLIFAMGLVAVLMVSCRQQDLRDLTLNIPEMTNEARINIIVQALNRAPGIQRESVAIDLQKRTIKLRYDSLLTANKNFEFLVVKAGFECNGIPADEKAKAALPPDILR